MQVNPTDPATTAPAPAGGAVAVRVVAGSLTALPVGELLQATVTKVAAGAATLDVGGQLLTVRPSGDLRPGAVLVVRVPTGATNPGLELLGRAPTPIAVEPAPPPTAATVGRPAIPSAAPQVALVTVVSTTPDGRALVRIDGANEFAATAEPLAAGGRYVLQVERTAAGLTLRPPADAPRLAVDVAAAVLRGSPPPDLGAAVEPLLAELAALAPDPADPVRQAAAAVREAVRAFLPADAQPPDAAHLRNLVENGGLHYEAKLARQDAAAPPSGDVPAGAEKAAGPDLKEGLLRLLQAARDIGAAAPQLPAARAALGGIEAQQAANVVAHEQGTPYLLQVPFPDRTGWRTLNLAVEPERRGRPGGGKGDGFRLLMHVPLDGLGETWIDAGLSGDRLRAVLYLDDAAARERVRAELPGLRAGLTTDGFREVLLDVRAAADLPARQRAHAAAMRAGRAGGGAVLDVRA